MRYRAPLFFLAGLALGAHPMGNFSVSHYTRLEVDARGVHIRYVLDLAEIPTFQLLQQWNLEGQSPRAEIERRVVEQAREWTDGLRMEMDGRKIAPRFERASMAMDKGAGGMAVMRITAELRVETPPGALHFEDGNFEDRAGWKEIVVVAGRDAAIDRSAPSGTDRSQALTKYPDDPQSSPPQDLKADVVWHAVAATRETNETTETAARPPAMTAPAPAAPVDTQVQPGQTGPGMVVRDDYLSRLLQHGSLGLGAMLIGLAVAFGLGAVHALSPGHGKTIVAAYLVGNRGTFRHAVLLGAIVTFTHTVSVFGLGLTTWFLSRYVLPEKIYPYLGAISGLSIVWIGTSLFFRRLRAARRGRGQDHTHSIPEGEISMGNLIALGASGGLVPCPSALVLLLSSVALGRIALGLSLLVAFSLGLALVLMAIGLAALYARHLIPGSEAGARSPFFRWAPVASAGVITAAGLLMTGVALGLVRPFAGV